jgi:acyl-CoA thioester hydrolase
LEQVIKLPKTYEMAVPEDYIDANGHLNMAYYTFIANHGFRAFFEEIGLRRERLNAEHRSTFALRQVISYLNELKEGDLVAVHSGLVDFDSKRLHFMYYIVNLTDHKLASTDERSAMYIDMNQRRSVAFEPEVLENFARVRAAHAATGWKPELSGAIRLNH